MFWNSLLAGLAIVLGTVFVLLLGQPGRRVLAVMLALAAGVMLMVVAFDLWPAGLALAGWRSVVSGGLCGCLMMGAIKRILARSSAGRLVLERQNLRKTGCLVFLGIALHDVLEGMAIAVGYGVMESLGLSLVVAIGIHHIPEGIAMAAPLKAAGVSWKIILALALLTALMTPFGVVSGLLFSGLSVTAMGFLLGAAGGAMSYLSLLELGPEAKENSLIGARIGFLAGLGLMGGYYIWIVA